ncbi:hypothetical protein IVZ55_27345 [Salmonella enterica subsp. enterica serovar Worthington]|nr:hypothetical protein [Salmonella enterica subsp. enterica serovar Worthington]
MVMVNSYEEGAEGEDNCVGVQAQPVGAVRASRKLSSQRQARQQRGHIVAEGSCAE